MLNNLLADLSLPEKRRIHPLKNVKYRLRIIQFEEPDYGVTHNKIVRRRVETLFATHRR